MNGTKSSPLWKLVPDADAPLPLDYMEAVRKAAELKQLDLTWPDISRVMIHYHGWNATSEAWRHNVNRCRYKYVKKYKGQPYPEKVVA